MCEETIKSTSSEVTEAKEVTEEQAEKIKQVVNDFNEAKPTDSENFLRNFIRMLQSDKFDKVITSTAKKYNVSKKKVATTFLQKVLGVIGDAIGVVSDVVTVSVDLVVSILSFIITGAVHLVSSIAHKITSIVTLNFTVLGSPTEK